MRLLVIDDSRLDRKIIKRLIAQMKMDTSIAEAIDAQSALDMIAIEHFDCILIDYHLPCSDGVSLAGKIAASHGGATPPMVMLTSESTSTLAKEALNSGLTDFMSKRRLSAEHLRQTLCNAMIKQQAARRKLCSDGHDEASSVDRSTSARDDHIAQALTLIDQSDAIRRSLADDEDLGIAIEMLRKAIATQQAH